MDWEKLKKPELLWVWVDVGLQEPRFIKRQLLGNKILALYLEEKKIIECREDGARKHSERRLELEQREKIDRKRSEL